MNVILLNGRSGELEISGYSSILRKTLAELS